MPSPRRARQGEPFKGAFVRVLEKEAEEFDQEEGLLATDGTASCVSSTGSQSTAAVPEPISDLYRQHSHQQSMEGG